MKSSATIFLGLAASLGAAEVPHFETDVLPVLYRHCFSCHSEKKPKPKGDLRLDSAQAIVDGAVVVPGKPDESELPPARVSFSASNTSPPNFRDAGRCGQSGERIHHSAYCPPQIPR